MSNNIQLHGYMQGEQLPNHSSFQDILACAYPSWKSLVEFHPLKRELEALTHQSVGGSQE